MIYSKIGGEIEFRKERYFQYLTDSGRSSLRLILNSLKKKFFLLPDFICKEVVDIFKEKQIKFEYYLIGKNFESHQIKNKEFDVLYVINYFGKISTISQAYKNKIIIEDNVFFSEFDNNYNLKKWVGFNSLRKISPLVDGSIVKSTIKLQGELIKNKDSKYVKIKSKGLNLKYENLNFNKKKKYIPSIILGESLLNKQKKIYKMSNQSIFQYFHFLKNNDNEQLVRKKNFNYLKNKLDKIKVNIEPNFFSFFVFLLPGKKQLISNLKIKNIFLPSYWPKFDCLNNNLYDSLVCIPLDSRYNNKNMKKIVKYVLEHIEKNENKFSAR